MQAEFYNQYKNAIDGIRLFAGSEIRLKVLMALNEGSKDIGELKVSLGHDSSTILHAMENMESEYIIDGNKGGYSLTNIGKNQAVVLNSLLKSISTLSKNREFWLTHDLSDIPEHFLKRIGDLNNCEIIYSSFVDPLKSITNYYRLVLESNKMICVSSIFLPELFGILETLINRKVEIEIIITKRVFSKVLTSIQYHLDLLSRFISEKTFKLWVLSEEIKTAFTVTDSAISFGLYSNDGMYDITSDLVSYSDDAIKWGEALFEYYRVRSKRVVPEDILID